MDIKLNYLETSEDGTCKITESNLEKLRLIYIYSSKAVFSTGSLTYQASITTEHLFGHVNDQRTLFIQSIFRQTDGQFICLFYLDYIDSFNCRRYNLVFRIKF
jgi:hypothetical protein